MADPFFERSVVLLWHHDEEGAIGVVVNKVLDHQISDVIHGDDWLAYIRSGAETVYHPSGTCRMGRADDKLAVVTPDLRIRGMAGLRIADASVFPDMVSVNICNTVMMIAERAAAIIKAY